MTTDLEADWRAAQQQLARGDVAQARTTLERVARLAPENIHAHLLLGGIAWKQDRPRDAATHALAALRQASPNPDSIATIAAALLQVGESAAARQCLQNAALSGDLPDAVCLRLAAVAHTLGDPVAALAWYARVEARADTADFHYSYATQLSFNGRLADAEERLERCIAMTNVPGRAYVELARLRRQTSANNHLARIEKRSVGLDAQSEDRAALEFARYKELEDLGRWDEAWQALAHGNAIMSARLRHSSAHDGALLERLTEICTKEFLDRVDGGGDDGHDEPQPIFIVGLPRSGTTLLDRLLGAHPAVASAGELRDFGAQLHWVADHHVPELLDDPLLERLPKLDLADVGRRYLEQTRWRADGKRFFIDKLPPNWQVAGLIRRALPRARILHLVRDPADVCFSLYRALFGPSYAFSYDLGAIAAHHRQYRNTMAHWHAAMPGRILDVPYADLVSDTEATMRSVLAHCGLDWSPACTDARANPAPVATLSFAQVRGTIDAGSSGLWRRYETQLAPLLAALA